MDPSPQATSAATGSPAAGSDSTGANRRGAPATRGSGKRAFLARPGTRLALIGLLVLLLALGAVAVFAVPRFFCGVVQGARHGLSCDVPLPAQATFVSQRDISDARVSALGITIKQWVYTIPGTTVRGVRDFYVHQLPTDVWTCLHPIDLPDPGRGLLTAEVHATGGNRGLRVVIQYANRVQDFEPTGDVQVIIELELATVPALHTC